MDTGFRWSIFIASNSDNLPIQADNKENTTVESVQ